VLYDSRMGVVNVRYKVVLFIILLFFSASASFASTRGAFEELILDLRVNFEDSEEVSLVLQFADSSIFVPIEDIKKLRVKESYLLPAEIEFQGIHYVNLENLDQANYSIDQSILLLDIELPLKAITKQYITTSQQIPDESLVDSPISGSYLNYDVTLSNSQNRQYVSGIEEFNHFTESNGNILGSVFFNRGFSDKTDEQTDNQIIRLDTNWTFDSIEDVARWKAGDSITKNASWSSSTRFAGIQYATNFDVDPSLVTYPLVDFTGSATIPSTLDVYTKARSVYKGNVKPGEFEIGNLPIPTGSGDFTVETRDITGKIQTITMPYYISPVLLKKDLSDYSLAFGVQRQLYATRSNEYHNLVANADYMHGINNYWTTGMHFEAMNGRNNGAKYTLGLTNKLKLYRYGVLGASVASNLHNGMNQAQKIMVDYSYNNSDFNFGTRFSINNKKFEDTFVDKKQTILSKPRFFSTIGYFDQKLGTFSVKYLSTHSAQDKIKILSANYSKQLTSNSQARVSVGKNLMDKKDNFITLSYNLNLENNKNLGLEVSRKNNKYVERVQFSSNKNDSGSSYRGVLTKAEKQNNYNLNYTKRTNYGNFTTKAFGSNNHNAQQVSAGGSVVFMDKDFYFSKPIYSSLVLVKVGEYTDIPVYNNNHLVANTNKKGKVLVPNVIPFATSKIRIDANKLPLDAHVITQDSVVAPKLNSGILVDFNIKKYRSVLAVLTDEAGVPLEENYILLIEGLDEIYSGYDGQMYIDHIDKLETLKGTACKQGVCYGFNIQVHDINEDDEILDLGTILCNRIS